MAAVTRTQVAWVGRTDELAALDRVLDLAEPRVCFVHGIAGIGKSSLLAAFCERARSGGAQVWSVDCASIDPTEHGLLAALKDVGWTPSSAGVVVLDTYEAFRIADPWLRHELLPSTDQRQRFVIAGRDAPMLEWSVERGRLGGLRVLPLGALEPADVERFLDLAGVSDPDAVAAIARLAGGHPLALRLAAEADLAAVAHADASSAVLDALAQAFRAGLDPEVRRLLDAAAVPRRVTSGMLAAMLPDVDADAALDRLAGMSFVDATAEGLRLHDAVHASVGARLRAVDPDRFRELRGAAWRHLRQTDAKVSERELPRTTADLLFLIDNPVVREAMFPTTAHAFSVEPSRAEDHAALRALWREHDTQAGAIALDAWLDRRPQSVRSIRDRSGTVVGCSIVAEWRDIPHSLERDDPVVAAWSRHAARHPLPHAQRTLVHRRVLSAAAGEGPSGAQAAAWLDLKRDYFRLRPHLGRLYTGIRDPQPFLQALITLGFEPFEEPLDLGGAPFHLASLTFGEQSIDGWLARLAADELGLTERHFLDPSDRSVDIGGARVTLSPLEFGVLVALDARRGDPATRADLLAEVWGTAYDGTSNIVDAVVRTLRKKLGAAAERVETVRGVGYRLQ